MCSRQDCSDTPVREREKEMEAVDGCGRLQRGVRALVNEARTSGINAVNDLLTGKQIPLSPPFLNRHQVH